MQAVTGDRTHMYTWLGYCRQSQVTEHTCTPVLCTIITHTHALAPTWHILIRNNVFQIEAIDNIPYSRKNLWGFNFAFFAIWANLRKFICKNFYSQIALHIVYICKNCEIITTKCLFSSEITKCSRYMVQHTYIMIWHYIINVYQHYPLISPVAMATGSGHFF